MDYEPRIVKLEVTVEPVQDELTQSRAQAAALDHKLDHRIDDLRTYVDRRFDYVDRRFSEQHAEMVQLRRDFEKLIYWVAGLTLTNLLASGGLALKAAGLY